VAAPLRLLDDDGPNSSTGSEHHDLHPRFLSYPL
jgi:hypothetical protein